MRNIKDSPVWREFGYIGGKWINKANKFDVRNPATGAVVASCPRFAGIDTTEASTCAYNAWGKWKRTLASDRAKILKRMAGLMSKHADDLAYILTLEAGKPIAEAKGEISYAKSFLDLYAEGEREQQHQLHA